MVALHLSKRNWFIQPWQQAAIPKPDPAMEFCGISLNILETVAELCGAGNVDLLCKIAPDSDCFQVGDARRSFA